MLIDLLQAGPGHTASMDRLITGNYKSNGNLVSLKVDIIDFTEFQRYGCLVSPSVAASGGQAATAPHSHSITGTLFCQPDTNTVRLNLTVLGACSPVAAPHQLQPSPGCYNSSNNSIRQLWDDALVASTLSIQPPDPLGHKDVKPWIMTSNKMAGGHTTADIKADHMEQEQQLQLQYSPFTSPVSPPCSQEGPPPLLDFHSDQLMSEIQSMAFENYGCGSLNSQLFCGGGNDAIATTAVMATSSLILPHSPMSINNSNGLLMNNSNSCSSSSSSSLAASTTTAALLLASRAGLQQAGNSTNSAITNTTTTRCGELKVSSLVYNSSSRTAAVADHLLLQPSHASMCNNPLVKSSYNNLITETKSTTPPTTASQPPAPPPLLLLQPKIERSDSICSDYSNPGGGLRDDFLSYSDMGADLDDLEAETASFAVSPPMVVVSASATASAACYPLILPSFVGGSVGGGQQLGGALSPINKGGVSNSMLFSKSFNSNNIHTNNKLSDSSSSRSSSSSGGGSPMAQNDRGLTTTAWSPSPALSLVLSEAMTSSPTPAIQPTTTTKSPAVIPMSGPTTATSTTSSGFGAGILNSSGHSSPKTPSSIHCVASPRSVGSDQQQQQHYHHQQQSLMLGSPLHHLGGGGGVSPKARNRRNSSFDESKPHVCPQCGARFTTKSNLGQHAKIHLAVKPFICEICSHGFTRAAHYESHVAKHKGLKTHRCDQCGESFARLDNLLRHSARHKHGKIFDCTSCGKGFHRKDKLLEHEKVHSEYKFPCPKCSKTFHTNDALKHHLPLHEDNSKTQCTICLKFITIKSLSKHMAAFHKDLLKSSSSNGGSSSFANDHNSSSLMLNNRASTSFAMSSKSGKGGKASLEEKTNPCRYCKKAFVSAAKLRLHVAKCHAEERHKSESFNITLTHNSLEENIQRNYFEHQQDFQLRVLHTSVSEPRFPSPSGDSMPSQQVPEMDLPYAHSSPEDQHGGGGGSGTDLNSSSLSTSSSSSSGGSRTAGTSKEQQLLLAARRLTSQDDEDDNDGGLSGSGFGIPTIHIPEFPDTATVGGGVRSGGNFAAEISNEAIQALFFN